MEIIHFNLVLPLYFSPLPKEASIPIGWEPSVGGRHVRRDIAPNIASR